MARVLGFQQIILASPVYWYAASPPVKTFLDRISDYLELPDLLDKGRQTQREDRLRGLHLDLRRGARRRSLAPSARHSNISA